MNLLRNPKPMKEASFAFLCSARLLFVFLSNWYLSDGLLNRRKGNDSKKSCLEGILSFGKEDTKNTKGNNRNKLTRFILEKSSKASHSKTISFDFQCFLPLLFLVELLFLSVSFSNATPLLEWNSDTSYPIAVAISVALAGQDDCIYVFGGQNSSYDAVSNSYKYNITAGSPKEWIEIASMKTAVGGAAGCVANDRRFFIFGGAETNSSRPNLIQIYSATDNSWNTITPNGPSIDDYSMSCAVDSSTGLMYITGGFNNGARFYSYNVSSNTITNLSTSSSPTPFNLFGQGSFVNNGKLYVFGGMYDSIEDYTLSIHIYDITNHSWSTGRNMTQAAGYFGYATDGSRFYAIGGNSNNGLLDYTQVYDIPSGVWSVNNGTVYSVGIYGNAAVFLDGSLHSIGGFDGNYLSIHQIASLCGVYTFSGPCDDGNLCTTNDTCTNGTCSGTSITCPPAPNQCQNVTCNPTTGDCVYTNVSGRSCNDNNQCLLNTTCSNGECTGQSKNCSDSTCDPSTGECFTSSSSTIGSTSISSSIIAGFTFGLLIFLH